MGIIRARGPFIASGVRYDDNMMVAFMSGKRTIPGGPKPTDPPAAGRRLGPLWGHPYWGPWDTVDGWRTNVCRLSLFKEHSGGWGVDAALWAKLPTADPMPCPDAWEASMSPERAEDTDFTITAV